MLFLLYNLELWGDNMDKIINIINSGKIIETDDILKIISLYIKFYNLDKYVKDVYFDPTNIYPALYIIKDNIIVFNDKKIIDSAYKLYDLIYNVYKIDENSFKYILNFYYLYLIYHELEHAKQKMIYETSDNELFSYLYEIRERLHLKKDFYDQYHDLFPMERQAINSGNMKAYQLICHSNITIKERHVLYLLYLIRRAYNYHYKKNVKVISPINQLFELAKGDINILNNLIMNSNLSIDDKIDYGLDIDYPDYINLRKEKHTLYKKIK